jgi:hypothetical protein
MSDIPTFPMHDLDQSKEDTQAKLLHNALRSFCDKIISDNVETVREVTTREVTWLFGGTYFRAKLVTFNGQVSLGQYDFTEDYVAGKWQRLVTPRALAEKLTEAKQHKQG